MSKDINSPESLIAYLDILGYSDLVNAGSANFVYGAINSAILRWQTYVDRHQFNYGKVLKDHIRLQVVSDTFIIIFDQDKALTEENSDSHHVKSVFLFIFLTFISYLIQDCMREIKFPLRGAIVKGKYFSKEFESLIGNAFIFSEGLVRAHLLAEKTADVPRILIDKDVFDGMHNSFLFKKERPDREILRDNDGLYYLNIYASVFSKPELVSIVLSIASVIRQHIRIQQGPKILRKYIWLANCHNDLIKQMILLATGRPEINALKENEKEALVEIPN